MTKVKPHGCAALALLAAGCTAAPPPRAASAVAPPAAAVAQPIRAGDPVLGRTAEQLQSIFGAPAAQRVEGSARRLQFASAVCVLDAYLYPSERGEASVTHVDTRRVTGEDIDRAACVAALRADGG